MKPCISLEIDGVKYPSIKSAAKSLRIREHTLNIKVAKYGRVLSSSMLMNEWMHRITIDGVEYPSVEYAARMVHVDSKALSRIAKKCNYMLKSSDLPCAPHRQVIIDGIKYRSVHDAAAALKLDEVKMRLRLLHNKFITPKVLAGESIDSSILKLNGNLCGVYVVGGKSYPSISAVARAYGIPRHTLKDRLRLGHTLESAILIRRNKTVSGHSYKTISSICRDKGINYSTVMSRLHRGSTLDDAFRPSLKAHSDSDKENRSQLMKKMMFG